MEGASNGGVRVLSRRLVRPLMPPPKANCSSCHQPKEKKIEVIHLTPWDLRLISIDYIQKGILLPKPPASGDVLVNALASSFSRALARFYSFAGRLAADEREDGTVTLSLRCTSEGAEFVHAVAPEVTVADIVASLYIPPVVWAFYPLQQVLGADAALEENLPLVSVQVTELADGIFIGMSMNHSAGDGTAFWHLFNTWSEIHRCGDSVSDDLSTPAPVLRRWFVETSPVPIPMPFRKLQDIVRRFERTTVQECFFTFSTASVKKLKARANDEMAGGTATATISSLQAVLAHLWRAVCRARRLPPEQATFYSVVLGCRGRVNGIPPGYVGNAMVFGRADATVGEIEEKGLGWTAWLLNRAVSSFDEAGMRMSLNRWVREPDFAYMDNLSSGGTALVTGSSPRFDVFGNDFGWGKPVAVRSGSGNKADGKATVYEGPERGGSMSLEVCIAPDALARLIDDQEFMEAVSMPTSGLTAEVVGNGKALDAGFTAKMVSKALDAGFTGEVVSKALEAGFTGEVVGKFLDAGFTAELFDKVVLAAELTAEVVSKALDAGFNAELFDKVILAAGLTAEVVGKALDVGFTAELFDKVLEAGLTAEMVSNGTALDAEFTGEVVDKVLSKDGMSSKKFRWFVPAIRRCLAFVGIAATSAAVNGVVAVGATTPASALGHFVLLLCSIALASLPILVA